MKIDFGMILVGLGIAGLFGVPTVIAIVLHFITRRRIAAVRHVVYLSFVLFVLLLWQLLPVYGLSWLHGATSGGPGFGEVWIGGGLFGLVLISWNAGRLFCVIAAHAEPPGMPAFDPQRSAAVFAALFALAFAIEALTRDTRFPVSWLDDWPPLWPTVAVASAIAAGLWLRNRWAWGAGLLFCVLLLLWLFGDPDFAKRFRVMERVFAREPVPFLAAMLLALLLPGARKGCVPPSREPPIPGG